MSLSLVFNDLRLECPAERLASLKNADKAQLERQCRLVNQFGKEKRQAAGDIASQWVQFRDTEPSKGSKPGKCEHLVAPGGSFESSLCLVLHYPSFTTLQVDDATVYDPTNPSIIRLVLSGFSDTNSLWLDRFCRRKMTSIAKMDEQGKAVKDEGGKVIYQRFEPDDHVEPALLRYHHDWLEACIHSAAAKVVVVFGGSNGKFFKKKFGKRLEEMKLWGQHQGRSVWLLYPSENDRTRVERLLLFVWHPEYVNQGMGLSARGQGYDQQLALAAQLGAIERSKKQAEYNTSSVNSGKALKAPDEVDGDKWATIKRRKKTKKNGELTADDTPMSVVCRNCRYPRLDISPLFFDADEHGGRRYMSPYTRCPACEKDKQFIPADKSPFITQDDLKRKNKSDNIQRRSNSKRKVNEDDNAVGSTNAPKKARKK